MAQVIIFRSEVLPLTQTFVLAQARALSRYTPHFVGLSAAESSLEVNPQTATLLCGDSHLVRLRKAMFRLAGLGGPHLNSLRSAPVSLVHAHFAEDGPAALILARALRVPLIVTLHGSIEPIPDSELSRSLRNLMYVMKRKHVWKYASVFICVSDFIAEIARKAGYPSEKLITHYIGVETSRFAYHGIAERDPNMILFVGRLAEKKGVRHLLNAMSLVQKERPEAKLVLIGDGPLRQELEEHARRTRLRCTFLGQQAPEVIVSYLAKARVFCGPSIRARDGNSEGLGMVFAESQACGLPVVSFRHGGIPEVVVSDKTGLLAEEGDDISLAKHILDLMTDASKWERMSAHGREWISSRFDLNKQTAVLENMYDRVSRANNPLC